MRRNLAAIVIAALGVGTVLTLVLLMPVELRHTAPFGFRQSLDRSRGIAVNGVAVTSNYANFNRVDLDLRAYTPAKRYDLTVLIRPAEGDAEPVRTVRIERGYDDIAVDKEALGNPFTTVRFDPIADAEGRAFYVWVERGPRNVDDIVALWSVKSYSRVRGAVALRALVDGLPGDMPRWAAWTSLGGLMVVFVVATGGLMFVLGDWAWQSAWLGGRRGRAGAPPNAAG